MNRIHSIKFSENNLKTSYDETYNNSKTMIIIITNTPIFANDLKKYLINHLQYSVPIFITHNDNLEKILNKHSNISNIIIIGLVNGYTRDYDNITDNMNNIINIQNNIIATIRDSHAIIHGCNLPLTHSKSGPIKTIKRTLSKRTLSKTRINNLNTQSLDSIGRIHHRIYKITKMIFIIGYNSSHKLLFNTNVLNICKNYINIPSDITMFMYYDEPNDEHTKILLDLIQPEI